MKIESKLLYVLLFAGIFYSQNISELGKTIAFDGLANEEFGNSVAIDGEYAVISAYKSSVGGTNRGAVYLYKIDVDSAKWNFVKKLTASDLDDNNEFGISVDISGNTIVVGSHKDASAGLNAGSAYIFSKDHGGAENWGEVKKLTASNAAIGDAFGYSVTISDNILAISAPTDDNSNGNGAGSVYIYEKNTGGTDNWGEVKNIIASDGEGEVSLDFGDQFGSDIAISGTTLVVGAPFHDIESSDNTGQAYVFEQNEGGSNNWGELAKLALNIKYSDSEFGNAVSIENNIIAIAAYKDYENGIYPELGSVTVFSRDLGGSNAWGSVKYIQPPLVVGLPASARFGTDVSISNNKILVSQLFRDQFYIYSKDEGGADQWGLEESHAYYDSGLIKAAMSGNNILIGNSLDNESASKAGAAYFWGIDSISPSIPQSIAGYTLATGTQVVIKWKQISDYHIKYKVFLGTEANPTSLMSSVYEKDSTTISGLIPNTTYYARVVAEDNGGNESPFSSEITVLTIDLTAPSIPTSIAAIGGNESARLAWTSSFDADFERYNIYVGTSPNPTDYYDSPKGDVTSSDVNNLDPNTQYYFRVTKLDTNGNESAYSVDATATTTALPSTPSRIRTSHPENGSFTFTWKETSNIETGYIVERSIHDMSNFIQISSEAANTASFTETGREDTTYYFYRVKATGSSGDGDYSNILTVYTPLSTDIPENFAQTQQFFGDDTNDKFGSSVDIEGNYAAVSAELDDDNGLNSGSVNLYKKNANGSWALLKKIIAPEASLQKFGETVSISKNTMAVSSSIKVFIFDKDNGGIDNWGLSKTLSKAATDSKEGISLSGDILAVGDPFYQTRKGRVFIYERNEGGANNWGQKSIVTPEKTAINSYFGWAVSLSGTNLAVSAPFHDGVFANTGAIYTFIKQNLGWEEEEDIYGEIENAKLGYSLSLSGDQVIAGASGSAFIYRMENKWGLVKEINSPDSLVVNFGSNVSILGDVVFVGSTSGVSYLFSKDMGSADNWGQSKKLITSSGARVAALGVNIAVIADENLNTSTGAAYIFSSDIFAPNPTTLLSVDALNESAKITWNKSSATDFDKYYIYGGTSSNSTTLLDSINSISDTSKVIHNLAASTEYFFRVSSVDEFGNVSDFSNELSATTTAFPIAPINLYTSNLSNSEVTLNWQDKSNIETGYTLERATNPDFTNSVFTALSANSNTYLDNGLSENTSYFYRLNATNGSGNSESISVTIHSASHEPVNMVQMQKIIASDGTTNDNFGRSVSISKNLAVVGSYHSKVSSATIGAAYVFELDSSTKVWNFVKKLVANSSANGDEFGYSVSIAGENIIVGALRNDHSGSNSGAAYIFSKNHGGSNNWGEVKRLIPSNSASFDLFGISVSISGNTAVVGASNNDDLENNSGAAYIFSKNVGGENNWGEVKKLKAKDAGDNDLFGYAVSISGTNVLVGSYLSDGTESNQGAAYIFSKNNGGMNNWGEVKKLTPTFADPNDQFGAAVSISGSLAIISAIGDDDKGENSGAVYIYNKDEGGFNNWAEIKKLTANDGAENDFFGSSLSISTHNIIVGSRLDDDNGSNSGSAYIYSKDKGGLNNWGETKKLLSADANEEDQFAMSVAIFGNTSLVGAHFDDDRGASSGSAYFFGEDIIAPKAATLISSSSTENSASLVWSKSEDIGFSKYYVFGGESSNSTSLLDSTQVVTDTTITISGLSGSEYYFRIKTADNAGNLSDFSNELKVELVDQTAPTVPNISAPFPQDITANIHWSPNTEADFAKYKLYVSVANNSNFSVVDSNSTALDTTFTYTALTADVGKTHYFKITAEDTLGNVSAFSNTLIATLSDNTKPIISNELFFVPVTGLDNQITLYLYSNEALVVDNNIGAAFRTRVNVLVGGIGQGEFNYSVFDEDKNIYKVDITLSSFGNVLFTSHAYDFGKNVEINHSEISISQAKTGQAFAMEISDEVQLKFSANSFNSNSLVYAKKESFKEVEYLTSTANSLERIADIISIQSSEDLANKAEFIYDLTTSNRPLAEKRKIGLYRLVEDRWKRLSGQGNEKELRADFLESGVYGVFFDNTYVARPESFSLYQNYPNPFNPITQIAFDIPKSSQVKLVIFNALGQKVKTLINGYKQANYYTVKWNGKNDSGQRVSSGIYFYQIQFSNKIISKKMVLTK